MEELKGNISQSKETDAGWKTIFTEKMQERGLKLQQKTIETLKHQRAQDAELRKADPPDELTKEWFSQDKMSVDTRAYMLENLMPSVLPGLEALLKEVEKKRVLEEDSIKFDPVNFLGEYLMRNNPEFSVGSHSHPYVRGLKEVVADLKNNVFDLQYNRLGQLKEELSEAQNQRVQVASIQTQVKERRKEALSLQFQEWTLDVSRRIPLALVQSAVKSFLEEISQRPQEAQTGVEFDTVCTLEQKINEDEFVEYVYPFICEFSTDTFQEFLHHLAQCADMFRETIRHDIWRQKFSDLFLACDTGKVGFLDRQRVLALLEIFYDRINPESERWQLRNPRQWPVIELDEMDPTDFWNGFQEKPTEKDDNESGTSDLDTAADQMPTENQNTGEEFTADSGSTPQATEARTPENSCNKDLHHIEGKPWSGDLMTADLAIRYSSYGDRNQDECNAGASKFTDLYPIITDISSRGPSHIASAFNGSSLNLPQFVQLMETFLGEGAPLPIVDEITTFIQKEYVETEEEKMTLLNKVRHDNVIARQKLVLQALFEKWDNEGSGFLELDEVETVLSKYKDGTESEVMVKGRESLSSSQSQRGKLSAPQFCTYIMGVVSELPGPNGEVFENLVEFLTSSMERTQAEKMRGLSRRKWLQQIQSAAETSGGNLDPVYKAVFQALYKDAENHGNNKKISASIGLLEQGPADGKWTEVLRYVACTSDDAVYVLNKTLHRDMKNVSFAAVDNGTPVHVPRVQYHGHIQFWNTDRPTEEIKGSLLVLPLIDGHQRVFGTLNIDTLRETRDRNIFLTHEISFYQGVTHMFSKAYHHVQMQCDILQLVSSALAWIYPRAPNIHIINTYLVEPSADKAQGYVFRNMMRTDNSTGVSQTYSSPAILRRRDNIFRDYLFKCADSSEVITTDAYGERHIAVPIRDQTGRAIGVLDLSTGQCWELPAHEYQDLQKMLQMLQEACFEILQQNNEETQNKLVLEAEQVPGQKKMGVLFHRFMLQDLRQCVSKLDHQSFAELKSYKEPPAMVHSILKAVLLLFSPDLAESEEIHSWNHCKLKVNSDLIRKILSYDPTARSVQVNPEILAKYIKGIPRGAVWKHGSIPAEHLFNWAFTCLSLLELTQKMQNTHPSSQASVSAPNKCNV